METNNNFNFPLEKGEYVMCSSKPRGLEMLLIKIFFIIFASLLFFLLLSFLNNEEVGTTTHIFSILFFVVFSVILFFSYRHQKATLQNVLIVTNRGIRWIYNNNKPRFIGWDSVQKSSIEQRVFTGLTLEIEIQDKEREVISLDANHINIDLKQLADAINKGRREFQRKNTGPNAVQGSVPDNERMCQNDEIDYGKVQKKKIIYAVSGIVIVVIYIIVSIILK